MAFLDQFTEFINPGGVAAAQQSQELTGASAEMLAQLGRMAQEEYRLGAPIRAQQRREAMITPEKIQAAKDRFRTQEKIAYGAGDVARKQELMRMGLNPGDPGYGATTSGNAVRRAAGVAGGTEQAGRAERQYRLGVGSGVSGIEGLQALSSAATGLTSAAQTAQTGTVGGLFGTGITLTKHGGRISAPHGGAVPEPEQYAGARDIPMVKSPDGSFSSPTGPTGPGGQITGPGTETSDSIPAALSHGEYIQPAFVSQTIGTPAQDSIVEVARLAQIGDPDGKMDVMKLLKTIAGFKSTDQGAPQRTAGNAPDPGGAQQPSRLPARPPQAAYGGKMQRYAQGGRVVRAATGGVSYEDDLADEYIYPKGRDLPVTPSPPPGPAPQTPGSPTGIGAFGLNLPASPTTQHSSADISLWGTAGRPAPPQRWEMNPQGPAPAPVSAAAPAPQAAATQPGQAAGRPPPPSRGWLQPRVSERPPGIANVASIKETAELIQAMRGGAHGGMVTSRLRRSA